MKARAQIRLRQYALFEADQRSCIATRWHDGAQIDYLGRALYLRLDTNHYQSICEGDILHLALPPFATERQIQDAAESWLRQGARRLFSRLIAGMTHGREHTLPTFLLSFSLRGSWAHVDGHALRLNWRLIEQPLSVIELTLRRAVAQLAVEASSADLFAQAL